MNLLLLHGLGQGPGSWDGVLDALGPDPGAACPDLFGLCGGAPDYPALYAALEDYAGALPEPVLLCGLSLGAVLAGLVLVAPQYKMPRTLLRLQNAVFRMMPERSFAQTGMGKGDILRLTASMMDLDFRNGLARTDCPALILVGEKDAANRKAARELAGLLPRATVREVPGAGHEVNVDAPRELAEALRGFWEKL